MDAQAGTSPAGPAVDDRGEGHTRGFGAAQPPGG